MSLLFRGGRSAVESRDASVIPTNGETSVITSAGVPTPKQAMRLGAYWAAVNRIAEPIATMPRHRYTDKSGSPERIEGQSVIENPGVDVDPISWGRQIVESWLNHGNAFGLPASYDQQMRPRRIFIPDPADMTCLARGGNVGALDWYYKGTLVPDAIHWPAHVSAGSPIGLSPVQHAARAIGLGLSAEEFGLRWFVDGAVPSAILTSDHTLTPDQAAGLKGAWMKAVKGRREPAVLTQGTKYEAISVPANESQFLETVDANVADIARFFGLRAEDIGGATAGSMTYSNVEQRALDFLTYPIYPWVVRFEQVLTSLTPRPQYVKLNVDALVRVDLQTRYTVHDLAIRSGMSNVDERRDLEDQAPLPDGAGQQTLWPPYATNLQPAQGVKP